MTTLSTKNLMIAGGCSFSADYVSRANEQKPVQWTYDRKTKKHIQWQWEYQKPFAIWSEIVAEQNDLQLINTASPGYGNDAIFHQVIDKIFQYKDSINLVVVMWSNWLRKDIEIKDKWMSSTFTADMPSNSKNYWYALHGIGALSENACINYFYRYSLALSEICKSFNIKLVMCQGTSFIKSPTKLPEYWNTFGCDEEKSEREQVKYMKNAIKFFIDHYGFDIIENQNNFIDWPLFSQLGGKTFADIINANKNELRLTIQDSHPNGSAHQMYAKKIIDKINE